MSDSVAHEDRQDAEVPVEVEKRVERVDLVEGELTDEQIAELQKQAMTLLKRRPELSGAVTTMVQAFRLHTTATLAMMRVLEEERADPSLSLFLRQAAKSKAGSEEFTREELADTLGKGVLPWLLEEIAKEKHNESLDDVREARMAEERRRASPVRWNFVDLPMKDKVQGDTVSIPRSRTLTVAGPIDDVRSRLASLAATVMDDVRVVHCSHLLAAEDSDNPRLARVGKSKWLNASDSERNMVNALQEAMTKLGEVDLIIVDDMPDFAEALSQLAPAARAANGHRRLRKLADALGCGLVIGVAVDAEHPYDLKNSGWSNLTTYSHVHFTSPEAAGIPA